MAQKKDKGMSGAEKVGIGVGLTAAAAAAAGAYFLYGSPNASKNRKTVKSWMLKARGEVLEALENVKDITEAEYNELVETVAGMYGSLQGATRGEITDFKKEMKDQWKNIQKSGAVKKVARKAKKVAKSAVRRAKGGTKRQVRKAAAKKPKKASKKSKKSTKRSK